MMKTSRGVIIFCLLAVIVLSCVSAYQELSSVSDLKKIDFVQSVPRHSLILLHWFANTVDIDTNNVVRLTFDPNTQDFGSHRYDYSENLDEILDQPLWGYQYYTVGNLNQGICPKYRELPDYVLDPPVGQYSVSGRNRDRIIVTVQRQNITGRRIDSVYLTQLYKPNSDQGSGYDPEHFYLISTNLLKQLRLFSTQNNPRSLWELKNQFHSKASDSQLLNIMNIWGDQAHLGLLYFIVIQERIPNYSQEIRSCTIHKDLGMNLNEGENCEFYQMQLEVLAGENGYAKIVWKNVPKILLNEGVAAVLFTCQMAQRDKILIKNYNGSYDTSVPYDEGLQVRLHQAQSDTDTTLVGEEICRGRGFRSLDSVSITNYAKLQLFVRDGKACARIYIKKGCSQWQSEFANSWVGFYTSAEQNTTEYKRGDWQWAVRFEGGPDSGNYNTFKFCSTKVTVAPGVQARFMIQNDYEAKASTPTWP